jgi:hypothetical protein
MTISYADQASILTQTAVHFGIPVNSLLGIYGQETNFGQNHNSSSTGAMGPFQFEPATARQYGYPMTNNPTLQQFMQQANAWGKYLVANNPTRSANGWAPAMRGGYTEAQAQSTLSKMPADLATALGSAIVGRAGITGNAVPGVTAGPLTPSGIVNGVVPDVAGAITGAFNSLVGDAKYAAVMLVVLAVGALLIFHGLTGVASGGQRQRSYVPVPV